MYFIRKHTITQNHITDTAAGQRKSLFSFWQIKMFSSLVQLLIQYFAGKNITKTFTTWTSQLSTILQTTYNSAEKT